MTYDYLEKLAETPQWVCWTYETRDGDKTKPPIAPFDGQRYAKSDDPKTWGTRAEAEAYHERDDTDTEGIGLMLTSSDVYAGADLDGCRDPETGEVEPWAEEIVDELDSYTEVSPSGTGLRVFLLGFKPGDRCRREQERTLEYFDRDDIPAAHQEKNCELEVYDDGRYLTFTGNHYEGTPTEAEQRNEAFASVYEEYVESDPNEAKTIECKCGSLAYCPEKADLDESELEILDADSGYTEIYSCPTCGRGCAITIADGEEEARRWDEGDVETARELLEQEGVDYTVGAGSDGSQADTSPSVSLDEDDLLEKAKNAENGEKFERLWNGNIAGYESQSEADLALCSLLAFWTGGDKRQIDDLFRKSGLYRDKWDEDRGSQTYGERTISKALEGTTEFYDPSASSGGESPPDPSSIDWSEVERGEAILRSETTPTSPAGELEHKNGVYGYSWVKTDDSGDVIDSGFNTVCNFTLETLAFLDTYEGDLMNIRVHPQHPREEPYEVQVHPTVFNDARSFREEIVRGRTTYFRTGKRSTEKVLSELRRTVGSQNAPSHTGTEYIGLHGDDYDEWVTPSGTLTAEGWADDPEFKYYEKGGSEEMESSLEDKWELNPEDGFEYDDDEVRGILERVAWTRMPERGLPVLGWFYAAPFKPYIHDFERQFNLLQVTGGTGTGKTSTLEVFYQLFGADPSAFGCGDTRFTIEKKLSSSCGLPIWLDEYKPSDLGEVKLNWLHRRLREVFREQSFSKGRPSLGEVTFQMRAPVVFSGEQTVEEAAVRRRTIMTNFSVESTGGRYQQAYCELTGGTYELEGEERTPDGFDLRHHARAYYQWVLSRSTDDVEAEWADARDQARSIVKRIGASGLDDSEFQGLQTIVFGYRQYHKFARDMGVLMPELPGEEELEAALEHVAANIGPGGRRREHIDEFTELVAQAASEKYIEADVHYRLVDSQKWGKTVLAFHMPSVYSQVKRYVSDYNIESEYTILSKGDYLDNYQDKVDHEDSYPLATNQRVKDLPKGSKAVFIDPDKAEELVGGGFERTAFGLPPQYDDEDGEESGGDDDGGEPGMIGSLEPPKKIGRLEPTHSATVVATVASDLEPKPWQQARGMLKDSTGTIRFVAEGETNPASGIEQGKRYEFKNVAVRTDQDGLLEVQLLDGLTEVEPVADAGSQSGLEAAPATTDGGSVETEEPDETDDVDESEGDESDDPEPPTGPHDDAQCRECGAYWNVDPDDPKTECGKCGTPVDWTWNVETGRVPAEKAPLGGDDTDDDLGSRPAAENLVRTLKDKGRPMKEAELFAKAAELFDQDPDVSAVALEYALQNGSITEGPDGRYDV